MKLFIPKDMFDNPQPPRLFLCNTGKKRIGELQAYDTKLNAKWNAYSELTFSIDRKYIDLLTGETKVHPLFDKAEGLRKVYVENIGYFVIQDPDTTYGEKDTKTLSAFSSEYETGSKYLENFRVNTGEEDSIEVTYLSKIHGENYTIDTPYTLDSGPYDEYESYYIKDYTDADSYTYQQVQIATETEYKKYDGSTVAKTLYIKKYPNVRFYYPTKPELSLLHNIFAKIPEWKIGHVDATLWRKERKFDEDRIAIYDFLMNNMSDTFKCVVEWDTITNTVNFYEEAEDGVNDDNTIQTRFDTDVFISRENLANEINIQYSSDDIKTKLKVTGADGLDIREINLGKNYIMNLNFFHTIDWMEQDLFEAYDKYLDAVDLYSPQYTSAMQGWVASYNKWNDLMNAVPADGNVVLVGDEFEKLYCVYVPVYEDGADQDTINAEIDKAIAALTEKLKVYQVIKDTEANKTDNILLRLKNSDDDIATIRIYNDGTESLPEYKIQSVVVRASSGLSDAPSTYTLRQWVSGQLTNTFMDLEEYKITKIGTMGAYFVLAKDEKVKENIEDYGVKLLQEKQKVYTTIFQTQTEAMYSQEKYQCTASDEPPTGTIAEGTRWFDTDSNPAQLYKYASNTWIPIETDANPADLENYQRYIDNYEKLQVVQEVLVKKERDAEYCLNGYAITNRKIDISLYDPNDGFRSTVTGQSLNGDMKRAAQAHFNGYTITEKELDTDLPLYTFTTSFDLNKTFVVYLKGTTPYVAYAESQGVYQAKMDKISELTNFENFFTEDQWIRLSPLIREDEFSDSNFLLTGYESEEERLEICKELMSTANKELNTLCQPSLEFSMSLANILALPEFKSLVSQFQLGNFVRVHIRDGYVKRARLLEVSLGFDDLSDFNCTFGNLITTKSEIDKHAELLSQAVTAGKQVATSAGNWQKAVDKSNKLEEDIAKGLQDVALEVGKASGQSILWDSFGIWGRKLIDGTTDQYEDEQFRIINNKLVFSNDGFKTSKSVIGKFIIDGVEHWGTLSDAVISGYIEGSIIKGGSLEIGGSGGKFIVSEDGSVQILASDNTPVYATQNDVDILNQAMKHHIELEYSGSTIFTEPGQSCIITCKVFEANTDITSQLPNGTTFTWKRTSNSSDDLWNASHVYTKTDDNATTVNQITITNADIEKNAQFFCSVQFDETQISS